MRAPLLLAILVLPGCVFSSGATGTPTPSNTPPPQYLWYLLDGNFASAKRPPDVRYSVVALDRRNGHRAWRHQLEAPPGYGHVAFFQPIALDGLVYTVYYTFDIQGASTTGVLEALDAATGRTRWRHEVGSGISGEPVISGGVVYLSAHIAMTQGGQFAQSGLVQALDARTGALRWQHTLAAAASMPAVSGSLVMLIVGNQAGGHLVALSAQDGTVRWDYLSAAPINRGDAAGYIGSIAPLVLGQLVYARAPESDQHGDTHIVLVAVHVGDGSLAWQYDTGGIAAVPAISQGGDSLCVSEYHINPTHTSTTSSVTGVSTSTGTVRWRVADPARTSPCVAAGATFYLSETAPDLTSGGLVALGSQDGRQLWQMPTTTAPVAPLDNVGLLPLAISDDLAVVALHSSLGSSRSFDTIMIAVGLSDGTLRWHADVAGVATPPEIDGDQIFVHVKSGVAAFALQTGTHLWAYAFGQL
jgi:outer membrane protein assembly factor BamB